MIRSAWRRALRALVFGTLLLPALRAEEGAAPRLRESRFRITEADRAWWAFQPLKVSPPSGPDAARSGRIDDLLEAELARHGLRMNPPATPRERARRAAFGLLGLPPGADDLRAIEADPGGATWRAFVDRLLDSPHYGERWGRHWLDLARYAESNGYERDGPKPYAWRYRDYVIRSFNEDKPYDRFVREQLAGDELAEELFPDPSARPDSWREAIIATGFFRLHVWDDEPDSTVLAEYDDLDDILVTASTAFLGLTLGCARCHDHKFDPFSQADYYSMLSFFRGIDPYGQHKTGGGGRGTGKILRPLARPDEWKRWEAEKKARVAVLEQRLAENPEGETKKQAQEELDRARQDLGPFDYALAAVENGPAVKPTYILARGDPASPRAEAAPAFPEVFGNPPPIIPERPADASTSGRRRALADWITGPASALTARVMVNRIWQHHFGAGLVPTPDDFGRTGAAPRHGALLDYLASEFVAGGWSIKRMHRLIMASRAYQMSSRAEDPRAVAADEANTLFWRQNPRRLEAEAVRDTLLSVSGALNPKQGGPSVFPALPPEVHRTQDSAGKGWTDSPVAEQDRRSIYLAVKRALKVPFLECLDFANSASPSGTRSVTTTAPQALMLLNDAFVHAQAERFRERLAREGGPDRTAQIRRAFALALQRTPADWELEASERMIADQARAAGPSEEAARAAMTSFCRALLNLNEVIYVD